MAGEAMTSCFPTVNDPDVYITEKWAIYSQYPTKHKIVGDFIRLLSTTAIYHSKIPINVSEITTYQHRCLEQVFIISKNPEESYCIKTHTKLESNLRQFM
jgi:hypothetical protein